MAETADKGKRKKATPASAAAKPRKAAPAAPAPTAGEAAPGASAAKADKTVPAFAPTREALAAALRLRATALVLWAVAIALEIVAIVWVLRPPFDELAAHQGFPSWRWWLLIGFIVAIGALAVVGSLLWKRANRHDPAPRSQPVRFFVQNQLGAIIALVAFAPLIVMVLLNKDMDATQKGVAGGVGVVAALAAVALGIDFTPLSSEQAAVESQVVTQLVGRDEVWWSAGGGVVHLCEGASELVGATTEVSSGTIADAFAAGKKGITLQLAPELRQCALPAPDNLADIEQWVRTARGL